MTMPQSRPGGRAWRLKKETIRSDLRDAAERSPVLEVLDIFDFPDEIRAIVAFSVPTLVAPKKDEVRVEGPVIVAVRYHASFIRVPPVPWEITTILHPLDVFHANIHLSGGLCIGKPPAGISMESILHLTFAAITLQSYNPVEWEGLNPIAADFIRRHVDSWPIVDSGLFEDPGESLRPPLGTRPALTALLERLEFLP